MAGVEVPDVVVHAEAGVAQEVLSGFDLQDAAGLGVLAVRLEAKGGNSGGDAQREADIQAAAEQARLARIAREAADQQAARNARDNAVGP